MFTTNNTKDWNEATTEMFDNWTKTSSKMWQNWFDLMGNVPSTKIPETSKENVDKVTQLFLDNSNLFARFMQLSGKAWQEIFPKIEKGENWQDIVDKYTNQMRKEYNDLLKIPLDISNNSNQLWKLYLEEIQKLNQIWLNQLGLNLSNLSQDSPTKNSSIFIELNNLYWNLLYEESFGSLMKSPILGPSREFTGKIVNNFDAWTQLYRTSLDYQIVLADIQVESFEALMKELVNKAEKGEQIKDWKEFQGLWSKIADDVFAEAFCQEDNLKIRGKFLNALNTYRIEQQKLLEQYFEMMNLPTRSEIDELQKIVHELRKEIKDLKSANS